MAQALMKRAIADIPIVTHIQKESGGMNKLYSQSMCSVKQWRAYQNAEAMVSQEVEEVRAEADEIEPGWSQVRFIVFCDTTHQGLSRCYASHSLWYCPLQAIWRQAMQYHQMLKQKHEAEAAKLDENAQKRKEIQDKENAEKRKKQEAEDKVKAAEKAAQELLREEENKKGAKKSFSSGGAMKKGFLK